jgi:hypothetical protein
MGLGQCGARAKDHAFPGFLSLPIKVREGGREVPHTERIEYRPIKMKQMMTRPEMTHLTQMTRKRKI